MRLYSRKTRYACVRLQIPDTASHQFHGPVNLRRNICMRAGLLNAMDKQLPVHYPFVCNIIDFAIRTNKLLNTFEMLFSGPVLLEVFIVIQQDVGCRNSNRKYRK